MSGFEKIETEPFGDKSHHPRRTHKGRCTKARKNRKLAEFGKTYAPFTSHPNKSTWLQGLGKARSFDYLNRRDRKRAARYGNYGGHHGVCAESESLHYNEQNSQIAAAATRGLQACSSE